MKNQNTLSAAMSGGAIMGALFFVNFLLAVPQKPWLNSLSYLYELVILYVIYRLVIRHRENNMNGELNYSQAFGFIFLLFAFGSIINAVLKLIYLQFIHTDFLPQLIDTVMTQLDQINVDLPAETESMISSLLQPIKYCFIGIFSDCFIGLIVGLIMATFVKGTSKNSTLLD